MSVTWPPPILGMTADQMKEMEQITIAFLDVLKGHLKDKCAEEGHQWGPVSMFHTGYEEIIDGVEHRYEGEEMAKRTCGRCGREERRSVQRTNEAINPFSGVTFPQEREGGAE